MKKIIIVLSVVAMIFALSSCNGNTTLRNEIDSLSYSYGAYLGGIVAQEVSMMEDEIDMNLFFKAFNDAIAEEAIVEKDAAFNYMREYFTVRIPVKAKLNSQKWLDKTEAGANVQKTESGLLYEVITEGNEVRATDADQVIVAYKGSLKNGKVFDESTDSVTLGLSQVIKGWAEGLKLVGEGGKIKMWIPAELAYGERGTQGITPNQALEFEVELFEILPAAAPVAPAE